MTNVQNFHHDGHSSAIRALPCRIVTFLSEREPCEPSNVVSVGEGEWFGPVDLDVKKDPTQFPRSDVPRPDFPAMVTVGAGEWHGPMDLAVPEGVDPTHFPVGDGSTIKAVVQHMEHEPMFD